VSIYLIGPRGAGKTTVGQRAARGLGVPFVDSDRLVEHQAGKSIPEIFAQKGERVFRDLERAVMLDLLGRGDVMASTGGGAVLDQEVRQGLRQQQGVVWLWAPVDVLRLRIQGTSRPSLTGAAPEDELGELVRQREPLYRQCADERVDTGERSLEEVVNVVQQLWQILPHHLIR